jgi:hypothetical protein
MTVTENPPKRSLIWPADYYSSATPKAVLPQWATFGCAAAALVVLALVFLAGAFSEEIMHLAISLTVSEMKGQYAADVPAGRKTSLNAEADQLLQNLTDKRVAIARIQPFLESLRHATADRKITAPEAAQLETVARNINTKAKAPAVKKTPTR